MDAYAPFLDRLRFGEPSMQRHAVASLFEKLRSAPPHLGLSSNAGKEAVSRCLLSSTAAVADQAVRELCLLVKSGRMDPHLAFQDLLAALECCPTRFIGVFVKAIGFLCRFACGSAPWWKSDAPETHPFVKVLSSRDGTQSMLLEQLILFTLETKSGELSCMVQFVRPFCVFTFLRFPISVTSSFLRNLVSCMASLSCSIFPQGISIFKILVECLGYISLKTSEGFSLLSSSAEFIVDAYSLILDNIEGTESSLTALEEIAADLLETLLFSCSDRGEHVNIEVIITLTKRLLSLQRDHGLRCEPRITSVISSLFFILSISEFEHEQLAVLSLSVMLLDWRNKNESSKIRRGSIYLTEELLLVFPVIHLMSSPSKSIKDSASALLITLESLIKDSLLASESTFSVKNETFYQVSKPAFVAYHFLHHLLFQDPHLFISTYCLSAVNKRKFRNSRYCNGPKMWLAELMDHLLVRKSKSGSQSHGCLLTGSLFLLCSVASVLVVQQDMQLSAIETLASIGKSYQRFNLSLLLLVLFYSRIISISRKGSPEILLKLLSILPYLASHSAVAPLILHTISPMLSKDVNPILYSSVVRLLCRTWEISNNVFEYLQGMLQPSEFLKCSSENEICISMAASIRDICKTNADRGVDLILSVAACIESRAPSIQALGLESLGHLCAADVVDFYTAWSVIKEHVLPYSQNPIIASSLALFLRWGAMDAEAYPEAARRVLQILWELTSISHSGHESEWLNPRITAFKSLSFYELELVQQVAPSFKDSMVTWLTSESDAELLKAMEVVGVKLISSEYMERRRFHKERKTHASKVDKILDVLPRSLFPSGLSSSNAGECPGAALICLPLSSKTVQEDNTSSAVELAKLQTLFEASMLETADSLQLSQNVFLAILSLQSWESFMHRWLGKAVQILGHDTSMKSASKGINKFADDILKAICEAASELIPRRVENLALAIGALGLVLPPSSHPVLSQVSRFLLDWVHQFEHESRQWTSAISLGAVSSYLHVTDSKLKFDIAVGLLEVMNNSKSDLVKGACGVGLGLTCRGFFKHHENVENFISDEGSHKLIEVQLLCKIVRDLSKMISGTCKCSCDSLNRLQNFSPSTAAGVLQMWGSTLLRHENYVSPLEDLWCTAGLAMGLGYSATALQRAGFSDALLDIKTLMMSSILEYTNTDGPWGSYVDRNLPELGLSVGACLALPIILTCLQKTELLHVEKEIESMLIGYHDLISHLLDLKSFDTCQQNLAMASCVGVGGLLSCVLREGVYPVVIEDVQGLMELMRSTYTEAYPPLVCLGGMIGVVNAMGASAGSLTDLSYETPSFQRIYQPKETSYIRGPLLASSVCESLCTSLVQEMFVFIQDPKDIKFRGYSAWALSLLKRGMTLHGTHKENTGYDASDQPKPHQNFSEDSTVLRVSLWLMDLDVSKDGASVTPKTVAAVLRCLVHSPRLPSLDWGAVVKRCMRFPAFVNLSSDQDVANLKEDCLRFSFVHAQRITALLRFLDEISDLPNFRLLQFSLQCLLLEHLADMLKIFSIARMHKLLGDVAEYFTLFGSPYHDYSLPQKSSLRTSSWKGLSQIFAVESDDSKYSSLNMYKFMHLLFELLPGFPYGDVPETTQYNFDQEWSEAMTGLATVPKSSVLNILKIGGIDSKQGESTFSEIAKKVIGKARLIAMEQLPLSEIEILKSYILSKELSDAGMWTMLLESVTALELADVDDKGKWLIDTVEISCISKHPSVAIRFLGILSSCWSEYAPLLILNPISVLRDLPVTLPSLLSSSAWNAIAASVVKKLCASTERLHLVMSKSGQDDDKLESGAIIDPSENEICSFLLRVLHQTCFNLKEYLPFEKQLWLANVRLNDLHKM